MFERECKEANVALDVLLDLLDESEELTEPFTSGGCTTRRVSHPKHGEMLLIETPVYAECIALKI